MRTRAQLASSLWAISKFQPEPDNGILVEAAMRLEQDERLIASFRMLLDKTIPQLRNLRNDGNLTNLFTPCYSQLMTAPARLPAKPSTLAILIQANDNARALCDKAKRAHLILVQPWLHSGAEPPSAEAFNESFTEWAVAAFNVSQTYLDTHWQACQIPA